MAREASAASRVLVDSSLAARRLPTCASTMALEQHTVWRDALCLCAHFRTASVVSARDSHDPLALSVRVYGFGYEASVARRFCGGSNRSWSRRFTGREARPSPFQRGTAAKRVRRVGDSPDLEMRAV